MKRDRIPNNESEMEPTEGSEEKKTVQTDSNIWNWTKPFARELLHSETTEKRRYSIKVR